MTKLVTILARELVEWPEGHCGCDAIMQDGNGKVSSLDSGKTEVFSAHLDQWTSGCSTYLDAPNGKMGWVMEISEDYSTAIITREMWQAERERLAKEVQEVADGFKEFKSSSVTQWRGPHDGLPPAGVSCMVEYEGELFETKIIGHDTDDGMTYAVFKTLDHHDVPYDGYADATKFSPIKSDRDRWIEAAVSVYRGSNIVSPADVAEDIYDSMKSGKLSVPEVE